MGWLVGGRINMFFRTLNESNFMAHRLFFNLALILPLPFYHVNLKKVVSVVVEGISELTIGFIRISFMQLLLFNFVGIVST